jgi:hypothetical protein
MDLCAILLCVSEHLFFFPRDKVNSPASNLYYIECSDFLLGFTAPAKECRCIPEDVSSRRCTWGGGGAWGGVVGCGTLLQAGRALVQILTKSLDFFN